MSKYNASIRKAKKQPKEGQGTKYVISNATVMYVKNLGYGGLKYGEKAVEDKPWMNHQYELDVLITPEIKKELKAAHKKLGVKEFTAKEFEETFKIKPPFKADEYLVTKFYKEAFYKSGEKKGQEAARVTFISKTEQNLEEVGIGNGSVGNIIVNIKPFNNDFGKGTSLRLGSVQITDLIEYELDGNSDLDEFDFDEPEDDFETEDSSSDSDEDPWDE